MDEVVITAENGRTLRIADVMAGADGGWTYSAALEAESATGHVGVYDYGEPGLAPYFAGLAAGWAGFGGTRSFTSLEGQLSIHAVHDGIGTVRCDVVLRQPWPPDWSLSIELDLGAGAHLEGIAHDLERLFDAARPSATPPPD